VLIKACTPVGITKAVAWESSGHAGSRFSQGQLGSQGVASFIRSQKGFSQTFVFGISCFGAKLQTQAESQPPYRIPTKGAGRGAARHLCGRWPKAASFMEAGFRPEFEIFLQSI
jgi:hypothetical protein